MRMVALATAGARVPGYLHAKESQLYADILQRLVESGRFVVYGQ